jgi:SAM-dependent methyltransferase
MSNSIKSPHAKRQFYSQTETANAYDELRFGGASGAWVYAREVEIMLLLLPAFGRALDLGCGTGRLTRALAQRGATVGLDGSGAMLARAQANQLTALAQGDAFALPFADASFDVVTALRLVFHFVDAEKLLCEAARMLAPGGAILFDTYLWSPRAWLPLDKVRWGGGVFVHSPRQIEETAQRLGLRVASREFCFLFSPYLYRRLPLLIVHWLARIEAHWPRDLRARVFWKLVRMA